MMREIGTTMNLEFKEKLRNAFKKTVVPSGRQSVKAKKEITPEEKERRKRIIWECTKMWLDARKKAGFPPYPSRRRKIKGPRPGQKGLL